MSTDDSPSALHFFVDEAGDPALFDSKGRILVGQEGCSKTFIVGKLDVADPAALQRELNALRAQLLADPYFKRIPSMQPQQRKTAVAFHAKDDVAEVRREVFRVLLNHEGRYAELVWDKVVEIDDMDTVAEGRKGVVYNKNRPLGFAARGATE